MFILDEGLKPLAKALSIATEFISYTGKKYSLKSSINLKEAGHYNTTMIDPFFQKGIETVGVLQHDGLGGGLIKKSTLNAVYNMNKPYIAIYKC